MKYINSNNEEERNNFNAQQKEEEGNMKGINISVGFCFQESSRNLYYGHHRRGGRRAFPVALLLLTLVLGMCILPGLAVADDPTEQIKPLLTGEDAEKERPDIGAVVYASVLQMRHSQMDTSPVVFTPDAQQELRRDSFQYLGFGKPLYSVTHFVQENEQENLYNLGVIMSFTDSVFRRCAVFCEFDYSIEGEQILVKQVAVKQLVLDQPQTLLAIVPADRVPDDLLQTHPTHIDLLQWIFVNSLKVDEVPEIPSKQPYYIFAATLDRIDKGAKLQIRVSDDKSGLEGEAGGCMDMDYEGWHVAIVRGEFALKTDQKFFIKVIYTPGDDVEPTSREPILIGVYSSDLRAESPYPTPPPKKKFNKCEGDEPYLYVEDRIMEKTVEIPIMMCNAKELANMDLDWSYNASVLKLIDVTKGSLNEKALFDWNEVNPGKLKIAFASSEGVTGSGSIAVMKFEVIGNTGDTSTLTGTVTTAGKTNGTEISVGVTPGEFTVGTAAEVPTPTPTLTPDGEQQRLYPVADGDVYAYSYRNWNWANWGQSQVMGAGWNPTGGEKRAYLKFDVPADLGVNRAVLKLYQYYNFGPVHTLGVYRVTGPWDEGTDTYHSGEVEETAASGELCWMQQPSFDPVSVATFTSATAVPAWVEVDITSLVQLWQAGTPNYGLVIKTTSDFEASSGFYAKEHLDQANRPVLELSLSGTAPIKGALKISDLRGTLNTDNDCNLYVADYGDNQVKMINPDGSATTYASGIDRPRYQVFDSAGNLYVGSFDGNIYNVSASGGKTTVASGIWSPGGMGFDGAGNLYVAGSYDGKIHRIAPDGSKTTMDSGFAHPKHLAVYSNGNIYVVDSGGTLIVMITPEGEKANLVDLGETILGMATDGEYLYVSHADKISRIDTSGQVTQIATGLDQPSSLTVCNGSVFVTVKDGIVKLKIEEPTPYSNFGTTEILKKCFKGNIYYLEEGTSKLPDFSKMTPVGTIYTEKLDIPPRDFRQGFPGITDRFEWFGISYIGGIVIPSDGNYTFKLTSDDGAKLYIDGELVIDNDGIHPPRTVTKEVHLAKGDHLIGVDYFQGPRVTIALQLFVENPDGKETPVKPELDPSELEEPTPTQSGSGTSYPEATLTHSGFDFSEGTTGESLINDGEVIYWQPGHAGTHPEYPDYSEYLWWRNTHLDDVNYASQTKDMGAVDIATVREVPAEWDKSPLIPPLLMGHTIVAKCYDGYVKFQVISVDTADESARVKYWYSPDTTFDEGTPTLQPTP